MTKTTIQVFDKHGGGTETVVSNEPDFNLVLTKFKKIKDSNHITISSSHGRIDLFKDHGKWYREDRE